NTFSSRMLLSFDICCSNDECQASESWIRDFVVFDDGFERAALAAVIKLDFFNSWGIVWNGLHALGTVQKFLFVHKYELCFSVNKPLDQPRASNAIHFHIFPGDPFH